jgi:hypothetical protein
MICPNCGAENAEGAPFCYNCANPLPQPGAAMPPGGAMPPSTPPGVPPGAVPPPGGFPPPAGIPPGVPPQWPGGGGPPYTPEPPRGPRNTLTAGLGGLIAFLVVAGIGALLFFTVFNKKEKVEPVPPPSPVVSVLPSPSVSLSPSVPPSESPSPIVESASPSPEPSPKKTNGANFRDAIRIFFCKQIVNGTPAACSNPGLGPVVVSRRIPVIFVLVAALDFEPGHKIETFVVNVGTRQSVADGRFTTSGGPTQRKFLPVTPPPGGFPQAILAVGLTVDGQLVQFQNGVGKNIVPEIILR